MEDYQTRFSAELQRFLAAFFRVAWVGGCTCRATVPFTLLQAETSAVTGSTVLANKHEKLRDEDEDQDQDTMCAAFCKPAF